MKRLYLGARKRQEEDLLWVKGCLGDHDPHTLLDTMLFLCDIHFALRSGEEHRSLRISQFEIQHDENGSECLVYTENTSKNNQGGLSHRKVKPKQYVRHRSKECDDTSYLPPLRKPKDDVWYSKVPVAWAQYLTVGLLCKMADISGYKTNHSLRVTSVTRLLQSRADEQLIMAHTGQRSVDGVRTYKRASEEQRKSLSTVLNSASSGHRMPYEVEIYPTWIKGWRMSTPSSPDNPKGQLPQPILLMDQNALTNLTLPAVLQ